MVGDDDTRRMNVGKEHDYGIDQLVVRRCKVFFLTIFDELTVYTSSLFVRYGSVCIRDGHEEKRVLCVRVIWFALIFPQRGGYGKVLANASKKKKKKNGIKKNIRRVNNVFVTHVDVAPHSLAYDCI